VRKIVFKISFYYPFAGGLPPALASQDLVVSLAGPRVIGLPPPFTILARKLAAFLALLSVPYERCEAVILEKWVR
jgi:hypothetical protein